MGRDSDDQTSPTLLGKLRAEPADQGAWDVFYGRYGSLIRKWCKQWRLQDADAEDLTQNVLLMLSKQMNRFEYDPSGRFRSWLKTVAYRTWCDFLEQRTRQADAASGDSRVLDLLQNQKARDNFLQELEDEWKRELLEEAMKLVRSRVQSHTWEAFRLLTQEELSGAEVADRLDMNVGAVWVAKSKIQKMIQEEIRYLEALEEPSKS